MAFVSCTEMVAAAQRGGYAVAQLNTNGGNYDLARAILEAAEAACSPIILGVYEKNAEYAGLAYIARSLLLLAEEFAPSVPVALHLDHGSGPDPCARALREGFTSVMYDGSKCPLSENIAATGHVCELAHSVGATCEAELGQLLSGQSDPDSPNLVSVADVQELTAAVPVDLLAVAIGNSHGFYTGEPRLNMKRLCEVRNVTDVPLVLHGTTGLSDAQIRDCISAGMAKVNLGTVLRTHYVEHYRSLVDDLAHGGHPWKIAQQVKERLRNECVRFLELTGSAGSA